MNWSYLHEKEIKQTLKNASKNPLLSSVSNEKLTKSLIFGQN